MPDPLLYLQAMGAAAGASVVVVLTLCWRRWATVELASLLGIGVGLALGYYVLRLRWSWPPVNGLDRLVLIGLPAIAGIELLSAGRCAPSWLVWGLRAVLAMALGPWLLHNSVYISGPNREWSLWQGCLILTGCGGVLVAAWTLSLRFSRNSPGISMPLAVALAILTAGLAVMLRGYLAGGAAALPLAAAIAGSAMAARAMTRIPVLPGILGVGMVGLFGLLFIGRFFGRLPTDYALTILLAPQLCWLTEMPFLRHRWPRFKSALHLSLVAVPLVLVLILATRDFNRSLAPLLAPPPGVHNNPGKR